MTLIYKLKALAEILDNKAEEIARLLSCYQPYEVTLTELSSAKETLLTVDKKLLEGSINSVATCLPSNLPLYSLVLFGIMPALVAKHVHIKIHQMMQELNILNELAEILELKTFFPNIQLHDIKRTEFIRSFVSHSDAIIFTGKPKNASKIIESMKEDSIMIANCSGHNPLVITDSADIDLAVKDAIHVRGFNSGQDCAGPNAILVQESIAKKFIAKFVRQFSELKMGNYTDNSVKIGPIHSIEDLLQLSRFLHENRRFIIGKSNIDLRHSIIEPTILHSSIKEKINYDEIFAPVAFLHTYSSDEELDLYFNDKENSYIKNKMYVSLYGHSDYIMSRNDLILPDHNGIGIMIHNKTIHHIEKGNLPFGGYSAEGSCVIKKSAQKIMRVPQPTLVLREIKHYLIDNKPFIPTKKTKGLNPESLKLNAFKNTIRTIFDEKLLFAYIWQDDAANKKSIFACLHNQISTKEQQKLISQLKMAIVANNLLLCTSSALVINLNDLDSLLPTSNTETKINSKNIVKILTGKKLGFIGNGKLLSSKIKQLRTSLNS